MGMFDDALKDAVPGGNLTKPLIIAAGALILSKMLSKKSEPEPEILPPQRAPGPGMPQGQQQANADDGLLGGLGGLLEKFKHAGYAEKADSWVGKGANQPLQPKELNKTLGSQTVSDLARQAGVSEQELLDILSQALPNVVDKLTPQGRMPTRDEVMRYGR